ncbi:MAG: efflux RND transporter periplasmic adaptor subunit [Acidobacteriota bacterium]|nr:efflux RND transporter periplasmic adaptor subunit [Acidobacteriota bacterium]
MKIKLWQPVVFLLAAGGVFWFVSARSVESIGETVEAKRAEFATVVEATGDLRSSKSVNITCPKVPNMWQFTVTYLAPEGTNVKEGTPLVRFDAKKLMDRMAQQRTALSSEKKQLEKIRLEEQEALEQYELDLAQAEVEVSKLERKVKTPDHLIASAELTKTRYDLELAKARLELATSRFENQKKKMAGRISSKESRISLYQREVDNLQKHIEMMTVKAPKSGLVVHKRWRDDKVTEGETVWLGQVLMELPELEHMEVAAVIAEREASRVKVGQKVNIRLDADPDRVFAGEITELGTIFRQKSNNKPSIIFDAVVRVLEPDTELMRPGMAARLEILVSQEDDVLQIPEEAVAFDDKGPYVKVLRAGKARRTTVTTGRVSGDLVEVLDGLKEGDTILVDNAGEEETAE